MRATLLRLVVLCVVAGTGEAVLEAVNGQPPNPVAQWILWVGTAVVLAVWAPIELPRGHRHR